MPGTALTSSSQLPVRGALPEAVVLRGSRTIDLSGQRGAVDHRVLEQLRNGLHLNDYFVRLSLANNPLRDNCVAAVCAILKDQNYLTSLSLENCDLLDKDVTYYLVPALLSRCQLQWLDMSKNALLTDAVADALARLIREGELTELRLVGVPLSRRSGKVITDALAANASLCVCELPYTIGFEAIDTAARFIQRNVRQKQMIKDQEANRAAMEQMVAARRDAQTAACTAASMAAQTNNNNTSQSVTDEAGVRVAGVGRVCKDDSPLAALDGRAAEQRRELAEYYTVHGRKNALAGAPRASSRGVTPESRSATPASRGLRHSGRRSPGRSAGGPPSAHRTRLPAHPALVLPPLREPVSTTSERRQPTTALLMPENEWRHRVDPATAQSMRCLDVLRQSHH